ncbi:hypothetical protein ACIBAC_28345 [Streptomyces sp. NPDC051362]|uniref:hypothetical protein n=1 Tax=Streptomyces sp. NPDC051362 TaxID=3365651 RepID=UPI0037933831
MFDTTKPVKAAPVACLHCGATLTQVPGAGRLRRFCTGEEGKAYRRRMRALGFPV